VGAARTSRSRAARQFLGIAVVSRYDLVVIGGGTAGMTAAVGAAGLGARVLLAEVDRTGGDCLWTGCVPSKSLIAAARRAHEMRTADHVGLAPAEPAVDLARIMARVRDVIATIEPHDAPARLVRDGVEVAAAHARFVRPGCIAVGERRVRYRAALIATGAAPAVPPVDGLAAAEPLTSDTLWGLQELPARMVILGGGPTGCELGQAFARLGSAVTIVEMADRLLPQADPMAGTLIADVLHREGGTVATASRAVSVADGRLRVVGPDGAVASLAFDRLLVAAGRSPHTADLGLDRVGVATDAHGFVRVDDTLRTTGRNIFAAGDVTGRMPFTHVAGAHGSLVATNALFGLRRAIREEQIPWTVFTDPEVAHVGLTEAAARRRWGDAATVVRHDYSRVDRAATDAHATGAVMLIGDPKERLVGATIVAGSAGESVAELVAWLRQGARLRDVAAAVHAYPTMTEGPWRAAFEHLRARYLSPRVRRWTRPLLTTLRYLDAPR
jgi:pyruvate/2-oxoglutarate dehydrogenase complex dihydrolipoamide dehydrogenase (E3) component